MSRQPLLSIVIPVYNASKYLRDTLSNVSNQKRIDKCEVLLINDGSKDNSLNILREYERMNPNLRVIDKHNEGVSITRNLGIKEAKGEYLYFMDADDLLHPNALEIIFNQIKASGADMVIWRFSTFYRKCNFKLTSGYPKNKTIDNSRFQAFDTLSQIGIATPLWVKVIKKKIFTDSNIQFTPGMAFGEDMFVSWKCTLMCKKIKYIDASLYFYRQTDNSAISKYHPNLYESYCSAFDDIENFITKHNLNTESSIKDIDYHFACRLMPLSLMENRAPYGRKDRKEHLKNILNDRRIKNALINDKRLDSELHILAKNEDIDAILYKARLFDLKNKLLFPIKRLLK